MPDDEAYSTIRDVLGWIVGQKVVDVTQHDAEEFQESGQSHVMLMFENGRTLKFFVGDDGFAYDEDGESDA